MHVYFANGQLKFTRTCIIRKWAKTSEDKNLPKTIISVVQQSTTVYIQFHIHSINRPTNNTIMWDWVWWGGFPHYTGFRYNMTLYRVPVHYDIIRGSDTIWYYTGFRFSEDYIDIKKVITQFLAGGVVRLWLARCGRCKHVGIWHV